MQKAKTTGMLFLVLMLAIVFCSASAFAADKDLSKADVKLSFSKDFETYCNYNGKAITIPVSKVMVDGKDMTSQMTVSKTFSKCGNYMLIVKPKGNSGYKGMYRTGPHIKIYPKSAYNLSVNYKNKKTTMTWKMPAIPSGSYTCYIYKGNKIKGLDSIGDSDYKYKKDIVKTFKSGHKDYKAGTTITKKFSKKLAKGTYWVIVETDAVAYTNMNASGNIKKTGNYMGNLPITKKFTVK